MTIAPATSVATAAITHEVVGYPEPEPIPVTPRMVPPTAVSTVPQEVYRTCRFRDRGPTVCDTFRIPAAWA